MSTLQSAKVDFRAYETESVGRRFEAIRKQLIVDCCHASLTNANLALLTANLIQLNDDMLGRNASPVTRQTTKLPMRLFHDYKPNGSVYYMVWTFYQERSNFRFSPLVEHEAIRLLKRFHDGLVRAGHLSYPKIFFSPEVAGATRQELEEIATKHGATVTPKAQATHIVVPALPAVGDPSRNHLRVLQTRGNLMLIHWYFHPDSYDTWLTTNDVSGEAPPPRPAAAGAKVVTARWLRDLEVFNEWMNAADYDPTTHALPKQYRKEETQLGKRSLPVTAAMPDAKKAKVVDAKPEMEIGKAVAAVLPNGSSYAGEAGERSDHTRKYSTKTNLRYTNISWAAGQEVSLNVPKGSLVARSEQCAWFAYDKVHDIEKRAMAEFFDGRSPTKTPEAYMDFRNFMVQVYEQNPTQYLTQTAVRRNLAGDVCAICRVHAFLEHWGLINYRVNPDIFPIPAPAAPKDAQAAIRDVLRLSKKPNVPQNFVLHRNVFHNSYALCKNCGIECGQNHFHTQQKGGIDLCSPCFSNGHFAPSLSSTDFTNVQHDREEQDEWTDQETLLLLTAIEKHPDDWDAIAAHVATKTKEQCVRQFVQMPIEDNFFESGLQAAGKLPSGKEAEGKEEGEEKAEKEEEEEKDETVDKTSAEYLRKVENFPFSAATNPVMSLVAFLASVVDPSVAATAAQAAVTSLTQKKKKSDTDAMDVDTEADAPEEADDPIRVAAATGLAEAVVRAQLLVQKEEMAIEKLVADAVDIQLQKLELKIESFKALEKKLATEQQLAEERVLQERQQSSAIESNLNA